MDINKTKLLEFKSEIEEINKIINEKCTDTVKEKYPIYDGPVNPERYLNSKIKIVWLLKESYDTDGEGTGDWSLCDKLNEDNLYENFLKRNRSKATWFPIIYASYGILNGFIPYNDMEDIPLDISMCSILKNIAIINISKVAGETKSYATEIRNHFNENKSILEMQLTLLNPDIIIGCKTLDIYMNLFSLNKADKLTSPNKTEYYWSDKRLYINANHPAQWVKSRELYIDDIIMIAKKYFSQ